MSNNTAFHTSATLRKHHLVLEQDFVTDEFRYLDWQTYEPASKDQIAKFEAEEAQLVNLTNAAR